MIVILIFFTFLLLFYFLLISGLFRLFKPARLYSAEHNTSSPVIIIPARNEEKTIPSLINSLKLQVIRDLKVVFVDDHSDDNTYAAAEKLINSDHNILLYKNNLPQGKKNALTYGIQKTSGEYILLTDADCLPQEKWADSFLNKFSEGYDLLFGVVPYIINKTLVSKLAAFENMRGFMLSTAAAFYKIPYSAAARSLGFKRSSFNKMGGYETTREVPFGDDGLLIREAVRNKMRVGVVTDENSFVYTHPQKTFKEYFKQRKRHTRTSFYYSEKVKIMLAIWHLTNLLSLFSVFLLPISILFILPFLIKISVDAVTVLAFQRNFGYKFMVYEIIYLQVIYEIFLVVNFFNAMKGEVKWK
jgi:glycosyltransferase involved in cell wall biosynthesis